MEEKRRLIYSNSLPMSRMNQLPDDILVLILSKLTMKEAARTSVISHRWEKLWVFYALRMNFDLVDATSRLRLGTTKLSVERARFISWVNQILNLHRGPTVDDFRVCFDLDACNGDDIERWIKFAMEKMVSRFELDISHSGLHVKWNGGFQFLFKLLDSPNNLSRSFGSLTFLRLNSVNLSDQVVAYFLSNCQSLEHLSIKGASSLTYLNATTALKLKHLEIQCCNRLKKVDISNTIIESLNFYGEWLLHPSLQELHLLKEVSLCGNWCTRLVRSRLLELPICQLQRLELDMGHSACSIKWAEVFPTFFNLKHLEVRLVAGHDQNIFCLTSLICASPHLSSFTLKVRYIEATCPSVLKYLPQLPNCEWRKSEKCMHECLKVVELMGWYGYNSDLDLAQYLMEKSVLLEKVTIDPKYFFKWRRSALDEEEENILKVTTERANSLQKYVKPGMEFVLL